MSAGRVGVGIVGAGNISGQYLATLAAAPDVEVRFVASRDQARARERAQEFGVPRSGSYDELLADDTTEVVVNLTVPQVHAEITARALRAGRHVWTEKPLALAGPDGHDLLALAEANGVRLAGAPDTFLGPGLQTAFRLLRSGEIGTPRMAFANFQYGGPQLWHPSPEFLFGSGGGPLLDMGPYYLTALVQIFGPVRRVIARATRSTPTRVVAKGPHAGQRFPVDVPTHVAALYEFADGGVADVILSFDTPIRKVALEVAGTTGAVRLPDPNAFTGDSEVVTSDGTVRVVPAGGAGGPGRGTGVVELVRAIRAGVPERADGRLALHVLDAMLATLEAAADGTAVSVSGGPEPAELLPAEWRFATPG